MANRVLRDWTCSETIDQLSEFAELFFTRLIMKADDFGRFYGSPKILKSQLYPLKDYNLKQVEKWRDEVVRSGVIILYVVDRKEYLEIKDFNQRLRIMKSKFPEPLTDDGQMTVNCLTDDGLKRRETETEVETETEDEKKSKKSKKEIPTLDQFLNYVLTIPEFAPKFESLKYSIQSKYEQWIENGWKDGHGNEIKQWKTKLKNTLPHLKQLNILQNGTTNTKSFEQRADDFTARILGINPTQGSESNNPDSNIEEADYSLFDE